MCQAYHQLPIPIALPNVQCVEFKNCELFACLNDCSGHGKCGTLGCDCDAGFFGSDCSLFVKDNCVRYANRPDQICWTPNQNQLKQSCNKDLSFQITSSWTKPDSVNISLTQHQAKDFLKCQPGAFGPNPAPIFRNCTNCLDMENITLKDHVLTGCPTLRLSCLGGDVLSSPLTCVELAKSNSLETSCPNGPNVPGPEPEPEPETDNISTGTLYTAAVIIGVVVVILGAGGYFAWMHYKDRQSASQIDDERELSVSLSSDEEFDRQASTSLNNPGNDLDLSSSNDD